jgi:hypothetical protein
MADTPDTKASMTCWFAVSGVHVECIVSHAALVKWTRVLSRTDAFQTQRLVETIVGAHLHRSAAKKGERWVVGIEATRVTCRRSGS